MKSITTHNKNEHSMLENSPDYEGGLALAWTEYEESSQHLATRGRQGHSLVDLGLALWPLGSKQQGLGWVQVCARGKGGRKAGIGLPGFLLVCARRRGSQWGRLCSLAARRARQQGLGPGFRSPVRTGRGKKVAGLGWVPGRAQVKEGEKRSSAWGLSRKVRMGERGVGSPCSHSPLNSIISIIFSLPLSPVTTKNSKQQTREKGHMLSL
jgi:hypothetical protein